MPTTFLNGPAAGQGLSLRRAPLFLRVVYNPAKDRWDALDQLADEPAAIERIHVYRLVVNHGPAHVCIRGKGREGSGWYQTAIYRQHPDDIDVPDGEIRETGRWRAWVDARVSEHGTRTAAENGSTRPTAAAVKPPGPPTPQGGGPAAAIRDEP